MEYQKFSNTQIIFSHKLKYELKLLKEVFIHITEITKSLNFLFSGQVEIFVLKLFHSVFTRWKDQLFSSDKVHSKPLTKIRVKVLKNF